MKNEKPSRTASKVAMNIVTLGGEEQMKEILPPGIVEATSQLLVASGTVSETIIQWAQSKKMISVYDAFDWLLPGQFRAFAHRKAYFEQQVMAAIQAGATQVLVLGAGYDTLGLRLANQFRDTVHFFEIDHPATALYKIKGVQQIGKPDNLHCIAEDLGKRRLHTILSSHPRWSKKAQSIILAEGLLMYLNGKSVIDVFMQSELVTGMHSRMAFSFVPMGQDGRPDVGKWTNLMLQLQKMTGEPWLWSIEPGKIDEFLQQTKWRVDAKRGVTQKVGVEYFCVAEKK